LSLVVGAMLYPAPVEILRYLAVKDVSWKLISHAALYFWTSVTALACLSIFVLLISETRRERLE
jgi:hypothetical protein